MDAADADRVFNRLRKRVSRPVLTAATIFAIAFISSVITAIVAALVLVEVIGLLYSHATSGCA